MKESIIQMKWKRPDSVEYPKVWCRFQARDLNSDKLVVYRIEDLPESRIEEALLHMKENYMVDEPLGLALDGCNDIEFFNDFCTVWRSIAAQKTPLVCYKDGSDEIIGLSWIFVSHKDDHFAEKLRDVGKSSVTKALLDVIFLLYEKFNTFEFYNVDQYLASYGLSVDRQYRGRSIGDHFLAARKMVCREFGLKLTHTIFSSDYSNRNAENVGFITDVAMRYDEIVKIRPEFNLSEVKSTEISIKTQIY